MATLRTLYDGNWRVEQTAGESLPELQRLKVEMETYIGFERVVIVLDDGAVWDGAAVEHDD